MTEPSERTGGQLPGDRATRLWNRFGVRALAVALLLTAVAGGVALGKDRHAPQRAAGGAVGNNAVARDPAVAEQQRARDSAERNAAANRQRAERAAADKATAAARAAARKAPRVQLPGKKDKPATPAPAGESGKTVPYTGPIPASCNVYKKNRKIGCALLLESGFGLDQMPCLDKLWSRESGWNHKARNRSSGAGGIPQALPMSKMASAGADYRTNPATQIEWGLGYIKGRYGKPCKAWAHSEDVGWY